MKDMMNKAQWRRSLFQRSLSPNQPSIINIQNNHPTTLPSSSSVSSQTNPIRYVSNEPFYGIPRSSTKSSSFHLNTPIQKLLLTIHSATTVFQDPERGDALASLGEITGHLALQQMYDKMMADPTGQIILTERPLIDNTSMDIEGMLDTYNENTFGQTYATFMKGHGFDPDGRSQVKYISDPELAYVMLRYRQCHDFWHALCDLPPTVLGEIALKWVELIQTGLPVAALSATVGSLKLNADEQAILWKVYYPWAMKVGSEATFLMNVYYEKELEEDLEVLRDRLGIIPAPKIK